MKHGFVKVGAACPEIRVGAPLYNKEGICSLIDMAEAAGVQVLSFPELALTGATCGDLFFSEKLLAETQVALEEIAAYTKGKSTLVVLGLPRREDGLLYDAAALLLDGEIVDYVYRQTFSADDELHLSRYFAGAETLMPHRFTCTAQPDLSITCAIGGDLTAEVTGTLVLHPTAEAEIIGRADYRRAVTRAISGQAVCAIVTAGAGETESTTDMVFGGHCLIGANGDLLAEARPFAGQKLTTAVIDVQHLTHDRMKKQLRPVTMESPLPLPMGETDLTGVIEPCPFLPATADHAAVCAHILDIQAHGLARRLTAAHANGAVVALSGGLDSTLALIATVKAADLLGWERTRILSVTMPCFGTTSRTRSNAEDLADQFGTAFRCVDIKAAVDQHFADIGHDPEDHNVVYENSQARERTQIIMDIANETNALVIGTGDLSELALGWATYNGDHMSNYGTNGGIPKTLIRRVVAYYADTCGVDKLAAVLRDILDTPVSPELLPPKDGDIAQRTEDIVGPYDLHDFFLYHFVRWGEAPEKIRREAYAAFAGRFARDVIDGWLKTFLRRFYTQQFKRSALPDGPMVGSVALSPRGAWVMPSDAAGWELE